MYIYRVFFFIFFSGVMHTTFTRHFINQKGKQQQQHLTQNNIYAMCVLRHTDAKKKKKTEIR